MGPAGLKWSVLVAFSGKQDFRLTATFLPCGNSGRHQDFDTHEPLTFFVTAVCF